MKIAVSGDFCNSNVHCVHWYKPTCEKNKITFFNVQIFAFKALVQKSHRPLPGPLAPHQPELPLLPPRARPGLPHLLVLVLVLVVLVLVLLLVIQLSLKIYTKNEKKNANYKKLLFSFFWQPETRSARRWPPPAPLGGGGGGVRVVLRGLRGGCLT